MRVSVDTDACIGSGQCSMHVDAVFGQDDDGSVVLLLEDPPIHLQPEVMNAVSMCPVRAITATAS